MTIRKIITLPARKLRAVSEPVAAIDEDIKTLAADMLETMYAAPGIGLAAIQVGVAKRLLVVDVVRSEEEPPNPMVIINPEILWKSDEKAVYKEGCLSIPEVAEEIERPSKVRVKYQDLDGKEQEIEADGLLAVCLQHEIDHLNGVLFIDYLSKLKKAMIINKFVKSAKRAKREGKDSGDSAGKEPERSA
ncbi:MAG: peptide deformylase [Methylobacteriaceae bacterium]|nr:peptide deformylase [Methylobacteriaceae bacterium]